MDCGIIDSVYLDFMIVGHTKFSPDRIFGSLRFKFFGKKVPEVGYTNFEDIVNIYKQANKS